MTDLLGAFSSSNVEHLVVGGWAVSVHTEPRFTKDLDLLIGQSPENRHTSGGVDLLRSIPGVITVHALRHSHAPLFTPNAVRRSATPSTWYALSARGGGPMATEDRRKVERIPAFRAVELSSAGKQGRCGVTRNASPNGLLIATPSRFTPGDDLDIALHLEARTERVRGTVVRVESTPIGAGEPWRFWVAVHVDPAIPAELLEEASRPPPSQRVSLRAP